MPNPLSYIRLSVAISSCSRAHIALILLAGSSADDAVKRIVRSHTPDRSF